MKKHKRHILPSAWSPYHKGYTSKERPIPSHIDVQGGGKLEPMKPRDVERLAVAAMVDSDRWEDIE